jgi:hypothetical protein
MTTSHTALNMSHTITSEVKCLKLLNSGCIDTAADTVMPAPVKMHPGQFQRNGAASVKTNVPNELRESRAIKPGRMNDPVMTVVALRTSPEYRKIYVPLMRHAANSCIGADIMDCEEVKGLPMQED